MKRMKDGTWVEFETPVGEVTFKDANGTHHANVLIDGEFWRVVAVDLSGPPLIPNAARKLAGLMAKAADLAEHEERLLKLDADVETTFDKPSKPLLEEEVTQPRPFYATTVKIGQDIWSVNLDIDAEKLPESFVLNQDVVTSIKGNKQFEVNHSGKLQFMIRGWATREEALAWSRRFLTLKAGFAARDLYDTAAVLEKLERVEKL